MEGKFNIHKLDLDSLQKLETLVKIELAARRERERRALARQLLAVAEEEGISLEDLYEQTIAPAATNLNQQPPKPANGRRPYRAVLPKYQHPESGLTWSGRGKKPKWIVEHTAQGKDLAELLIQTQEAQES